MEKILRDIIPDYTQKDDLMRLKRITGFFNTNLASRLENSVIFLKKMQYKLEDGDELTSDEREKIGEIGRWMYDELYSAIGIEICNFNDIKYKNTRW